MHWFFQKFQFLQCHFFPSCCKLAMAWHGKSLRMNFSCPDSEFWLDDRKVLGFCGVLYSETFKALWWASGKLLVERYLQFQMRGDSVKSRWRTTLFKKSVKQHMVRKCSLADFTNWICNDSKKIICTNFNWNIQIKVFS